MSIANELQLLQTNLTSSYDACEDKGATLPVNKNFSNLASCIDTIPTGGSPTITSLNVTPTTSSQVITAPSGTDGYSPVNVSAVTSSIDNNITAGNIKNGVSILGVTGTYQGTTPTGTINITENGTYNVTNYASANVSVSGGGGSNNRKIAPYNCTIEYFDELPFTKDSNEPTSTDGLSRYGTFNFSKSDMIPVSAADGTTYSDAYLNPSYDNSNGHTIYDFASEQYYTRTVIRKLYSNPADCPPVLNFGAITTITLSGACQYATYLEKVLFPNVTSLNIKNSFSGCTNLSVIDMPKVNTLPSGAFQGSSGRGAFQGTAIQTLSFPALTSTSFGSYTNQFNNMLSGVTGCTVHFPSNLQSVIGSWTSVTSGFGGTNTTVLFDLPATT